MVELSLLLLLLGLIPAMIAHRKGGSFLIWWIYGALLFIIALPNALLLKPDQQALERQQAREGLKKCPYCAEMVKPDAKVCRYCSRELTGAGSAASRTRS